MPGNVSHFAANSIADLTDEELLIRLKDAEHDFVERKPKSQRGDWLQTAVAFANSAPIGRPAVLFVGVSDAGVPQEKAEKLEDLETSVAAVIGQAYPAIYFNIRPVRTDEGGCLAVIVPGSPLRPHFAGKAYVRNGPSTTDASPEQFAALIASRNSKAHMILEWVGKDVSLVTRAPKKTPGGWSAEFTGRYSNTDPQQAKVLTCNANYVTLKFVNGHLQSCPLSWLELSFDHSKEQLIIYAYADR